jgi:hypothetical protein
MEVSSPLTVRLGMNAALCSDYENLRDVRTLGLPEQAWPAALERGPGESLAAWRDRLYHAYRLPVIIAGLADLKFSYVEQASPLLARSVLECVRELPDSLRTEKELFRSIVEALGPKVRFARRDSVASVKDLLKRPEMVALLRTELEAPGARGIFPEALLQREVRDIRTVTPGAGKPAGRPGLIARLKSLANRLLPVSLKRRLRDAVGAPSLDGNVLAFRIFLALRMRAMLKEDAAAGAALKSS